MILRNRSSCHILATEFEVCLRSFVCKGASETVEGVVNGVGGRLAKQ